MADSTPIPALNGLPDPEPGWFPDYDSPGFERYWNGSNWTEDIRPNHSITVFIPKDGVIYQRLQERPGIPKSLRVLVYSIGILAFGLAMPILFILYSI